MSQRAAPRLRIQELRSLPYFLGYLSGAKRTFTGGPKRSNLYSLLVSKRWNNLALLELAGIQNETR
jgi:hypothetical protein